jgi:hypothetical protein
MTYFLCKMVLPRSDFEQTMTDSEKKHHEGSPRLPSEPGRSWFDRVSRLCG